MKDAASSHAPGTRSLDRLELGAAAALVLALVWAHAELWTHAGALWRDEVSSVNVATRPSFGEMLREHHWDSFPVLWCVVLRGWIALGVGADDSGLRALGFAIGLAIVAAAWWTARGLGCRAPLVSLAFFALNPAVIRFGDAVRGYGLGVLGLIVAVGAVARMVERFSVRRALVALAAALLAVQSLFTNCALLVALGLAGATVCARRRAWRPLAWLAAIGVAAALSMLPYLRVLAIHGEWSMIVRTPVDFAWVRDRFLEAVGSAGPVALGAWGALAVAAATAWTAALARRAGGGVERDRALFTAVLVLAGGACFVAYLEALSVPTQAWYHLPLLALAALGLEAALHGLVNAHPLGRLARLAGVLALAAISVPHVRDALVPRATCVDVIADELERRAAKDDLIVVYPWYAGLTFARYYDGAAPWMVVPDLDVRLRQPYLAFKQRMTEARPIVRELERIAGTLRAGRRVWLVGGQIFPRPGEPPGDLPPAPRGPAGWHEPAYTEVWSRQTGHCIREHAARIVAVPLPSPGPVLWYENLPLVLAEGRR